MATFERKIAAMQVYESEARSFPHPRTPESLRAIAKRYGSVSGMLAAEAFSNDICKIGKRRSQ